MSVVLADSQPLGQQQRVLKHRNTFGVFDERGDVVSRGLGEQGLYHLDTRHLSRFAFRLGGKHPLVLSSAVTHGNFLLALDMTNPDIGAGPEMSKNSLHVFRGRFLRDGALYEELRFTNYGDVPISLPCRLEFESDFRDLFEVRGSRRPERGEILEPRLRDGEVVLAYRGLDGIVRRTRIQVTGEDIELEPGAVHFQVELVPGSLVARQVTVRCEQRRHPDEAQEGMDPERQIRGYSALRGEAWAELDARRRRFASLSTSNEHFNDWWNRSLDDSNVLLSELSTGSYPYAGIPWFSAPFGRDGIITALQLLWVAPFVARGVLGYLAATQAEAVVPERDAEPGKILHEARAGEMANRGEVPFGRYYGSLDSTPLFVLLAAAYWRRTGDREMLRSLLPSIERALEWMETYGDADGDGFLEYERKRPEGLENQAWKDSHDSMFHADGSSAPSPIAPVEVQAYAYRARREMADVFRALGRETDAARQEERAEDLRCAFEERFWSPDLGMYAMALDGEKRPLLVPSSNAGHALFGGLPSPERAERTAEALMGDEMFSGWGIRTVGSGAARYNPMSYHNGSVWPHDNALVAFGMSRYGLTESSAVLLRSLFDVSLFLPLRRLPELFCGFHRRSGEAPVSYPVACAPQAWAAGSVSMLLQATLGLTVDAVEGVVRVRRPSLPEPLEHVTLEDLPVGPGRVGLRFRREEADVEVDVLRADGELDVQVARAEAYRP